MVMRTLLTGLAVVGAMISAAPTLAQDPQPWAPVFQMAADGGAPAASLTEEPRLAVLRGLEKVSARVREIEVPVGQTVRFGGLAITVRACASRPPEEPPETTAYLDIDDNRLDGSVERVFSGWMFASSPALNALEHPTYDVWVMDCKAIAPDASNGSR